jgi:hypothetical protein
MSTCSGDEDSIESSDLLLLLLPLPLLLLLLVLQVAALEGAACRPAAAADVVVIDVVASMRVVVNVS